MEPTLEEVQELRTRFGQKAQEENKDFHPKDLARVNTDDHWLKRFLVHHESDKEEALKMMFETCEWRRTNKVNEMVESSLNRDSLVSGSLYLHNKDRDGKPLLIFKCARHVKGQKNMEDLKKVVIYWFERAERTGNDQITIFFDMLNTGLSNLDMEYIKYLITICKLYYPNFLNYILIFEMPWVLNAAFKIIKSWLPAKAVQKIKFVTKGSLKDFVDPSQSLVSWGGTDSYEFVFVSDMGSGEYAKSDENKKKVHFAKDHERLMYEVVDGSSASPLSNSSCNESASVKVTPSDAIAFVQEGIEMSGHVTISNISERPITFKVKTTKPEKFRVRPYCGSIGVGSSVQVTVVLLSGFNASSIVQEKFLVLTVPLDTDNPTASQISEAWKTTDTQEIEEFKLRCRVISSPSQQIVQANGAVGSAGSSDLEQKVSQLLLSMNHVTEICSGIEAELKTWRRLATFSIAAFIGLVIFIFFAYYSPSEGLPDNPEL